MSEERYFEVVRGTEINMKILSVYRIVMSKKLYNSLVVCRKRNESMEKFLVEKIKEIEDCMVNFTKCQFFNKEFSDIMIEY